MNHIIEMTPDMNQPDNLSNCRVRRINSGMAMCTVNAYCMYDLPYGDLCAHTLACQMAEAWEYMPRRAEKPALPVRNELGKTK